MCHLLENFASSIFLPGKSQTTEDCEEILEAVMDTEQSLHDCFLGNAIFPCWKQAVGCATFDLCSAQLQLRWYGLRSISISYIDKLPSNTHWSIIWPDAAAIVLMISSFLNLNVFLWFGWVFQWFACFWKVYIEYVIFRGMD